MSSPPTLRSRSLRLVALFTQNITRRCVRVRAWLQLEIEFFSTMFIINNRSFSFASFFHDRLRRGSSSIAIIRNTFMLRRKTEQQQQTHISINHSGTVELVLMLVQMHKMTLVRSFPRLLIMDGKLIFQCPRGLHEEALRILLECRWI